MRIDRMLLAACLLLLMPIAHAGEATPLEGLDGVLFGGQAEEKLDELDPVVIVGGFATPKMWKVSKGDHVLWVLGDARAPAGVKWRTEQMDARIAESQLLLNPGLSRSGPDVGVFKAIGLITLIPSAFKAVKNPDGKTLKDVLPPDVYARWSVLKTTYAPKDNDIERWRPSIALGKLMKEAAAKILVSAKPQQVGTPPGPPLRPLVDKAVKKYKVKVHTMPDVERR